MTEERSAHGDIVRMAVGIVTSYVGNNQMPGTQVPETIADVYRTLSALGGGLDEAAAPKPAVPIRRSVMPDHIVCLEDGKKLKMLKRYLRSTHGMSPEEYRAKWGLPADYPMVAPEYAKKRSEFAHKIGLGKNKPKTGSRQAHV